MASQEGWEHVANFTDQLSGATLERPGIRRALAQARAGRFDVLLVYRTDRLSRSVRGLAQVIEDLDGAGVAFRSATEPFDTQAAAGRMMVQMLGVFAEFERATIIDRVIAGMERKAAQGGWCGGHEPVGYRAVKGEGRLAGRTPQPQLKWPWLAAVLSKREPSRRPPETFGSAAANFSAASWTPSGVLHRSLAELEATVDEIDAYQPLLRRHSGVHGSPLAHTQRSRADRRQCWRPLCNQYVEEGQLSRCWDSGCKPCCRRFAFGEDAQGSTAASLPVLRSSFCQRTTSSGCSTANSQGQRFRRHR